MSASVALAAVDADARSPWAEAGLGFPSKQRCSRRRFCLEKYFEKYFSMSRSSQLPWARQLSESGPFPMAETVLAPAGRDQS